jgi:hypothetical protein
MGIEAEKIEQLIEMNAESVAGLKDRIAELEEEGEKASQYKKDAENLKIVQKELDELKEKVEADTKEREGKDYDKLKKEFDEYKADQERKAERQAKETAYTEILKDAGIPEKHWKKILKYSDVDGVELDEKGKVKTAKEILKSVKEEWSDHIETTQTQGADIQTPPSNNSSTKMTKSEIFKRDEKGNFVLSSDEREKAIAENMSEFM